MEYQASNARAWPDGLVASFAPTLSEIGGMLARFPVLIEHLPKQIRMVLATGCDEAREPRKVAYCRGDDSIVISEANMKVCVFIIWFWELTLWEKAWKKPEKMKRLLLHEIWHLFSRNAPEDLMDQCYSVFGFKRIPKKHGAPYPEEISLLRFTNPDGAFKEEFFFFILPLLCLFLLLLVVCFLLCHKHCRNVCFSLH